jgi:hypothetical protein
VQLSAENGADRDDIGNLPKDANDAARVGNRRVGVERQGSFGSEAQLKAAR